MMSFQAGAVHFFVRNWLPIRLVARETIECFQGASGVASALSQLSDSSLAGRRRDAQPDVSVTRLIERARHEEPRVLDRLLESFRNYLLLLARTSLDASLQGKADASDLVQGTMLKAHRRFRQFRGQTE